MTLLIGAIALIGGTAGSIAVNVASNAIYDLIKGYPGEAICSEQRTSRKPSSMAPRTVIVITVQPAANTTTSRRLVSRSGGSTVCLLLCRAKPLGRCILFVGGAQLADNHPRVPICPD